MARAASTWRTATSNTAGLWTLSRCVGCRDGCDTYILSCVHFFPSVNRSKNLKHTNIQGTPHAWSVVDAARRCWLSREGCNSDSNDYSNRLVKGMPKRHDTTAVARRPATQLFHRSDRLAEFSIERQLLQRWRPSDSGDKLLAHPPPPTLRLIFHSCSRTSSSLWWGLWPRCATEQGVCSGATCLMPCLSSRSLPPSQSCRY